ncbi:uncharacterized protein LOC103520502 [Diaphorina citri]|uniref:Uncharacterized protein LOC103520502 n=1 Tax=Diaphorina citri TaxID=121845 RepID=A0A1S4EPZ5_DIACI|nr:uncharacterized protein LOC103520502 [Diaphorina citri]
MINVTELNCLITGFDPWDILISLRPNMLEAVCDKFTDNFQRQSAAVQQLEYNSFLQMKINLIKIMPNGNSKSIDLTYLSMLNSISTAFKSLLRPSDLASPDKEGPASVRSPYFCQKPLLLSEAGIGKETAKDLAKRGAKVIMACRNLELANKVRDLLKKSSPSRIVIVASELYRFATVNLDSPNPTNDVINDIHIKFESLFLCTEKKLDVLINNAGMADTFTKKTTEKREPGGIGKETAKDLAKRGAKVIMACRNLELANKVREQIVAETGNDSVVVKKLNLSSLQSVREFAADIYRTEKKLDVLINNAGMADTFTKKTTDKHCLPDSNPTTQLPAYLYYVSKYANIMFSLELARRLEGSGVTVNCLHPGMIDSGIWRNVPFPLNLPLQLIVKTFFKTPEQGAQTSIYLAVSKEVEGVSGKYFSDCKETSLSSGIQDMTKNKKYWEICERLVKL